MISASAPGKVVLWGEYAVLTGAPAMVLAVDRYATCSIDPGGDTWRFSTRGFAAPDVELTVAELTSDVLPEQVPKQAALVARRVIRHLQPTLRRTKDPALLPVGARVATDTRGFFHDVGDAAGEKLGIGSSAAICTAVYGACCKLLGVPLDFAQALDIHNDFQEKRGSGIDVAAAFYGGALRFESQVASAFDLTPELQLRFVWTGKPAKTTSHIQRFNTWHERGQLEPLAALASTSAALFASTDLATLRRYCDELKALDAAAALGIYSKPHRLLDRLAIDAEVVYKPCGAGGGDLGVAICDQPQRLDTFVAAAADLGFDSLALEKAQHGVQVAR